MSDWILIALGIVWAAAAGHDFGRYRQRKIDALHPSDFHTVGKAIWGACKRIQFTRKIAGILSEHRITCELECGADRYTVTIEPKNDVDAKPA